MALILSGADLSSYCAAPVGQATAVAEVAGQVAAMLDRITGRNLAWRRYRVPVGLTADIVVSTKTLTHAGTVTVNVGDCVDGPGIPFGALVASVTNPTTFVLDMSPAGDATGVDLTLGGGLMRAWPDRGAWLRVDETPITDATALYLDGALLEGVTPVVVSGPRGLVDVNTYCQRGGFYELAGAAGLRSGSEYEMARATLQRMGQIVWQRSFAHAGATSSEIIGTRSLTRDFQWPADVQQGIDALRRLA